MGRHAGFNTMDTKDGHQGHKVIFLDYLVTLRAHLVTFALEMHRGRMQIGAERDYVKGSRQRAGQAGMIPHRTWLWSALLRGKTCQDPPLRSEENPDGWWRIYTYDELYEI